MEFIALLIIIGIVIAIAMKFYGHQTSVTHQSYNEEEDSDNDFEDDEPYTHDEEEVEDEDFVEDEEKPDENWSRIEIEENVLTIVQNTLCPKVKDKFSLKQRSFNEDMEADEFTFIEVMMAVETNFNISIPDEDTQKFNTPNDIIEYVYNKFYVADVYCSWCNQLIKPENGYWEPVEVARKAFDQSDLFTDKVELCSMRCIKEAEKEIGFKRDGHLQDYYSRWYMA